MYVDQESKNLDHVGVSLFNPIGIPLNIYRYVCVYVTGQNLIQVEFFFYLQVDSQFHCLLALIQE